MGSFHRKNKIRASKHEIDKELARGDRNLLHLRINAQFCQAVGKAVALSLIRFPTFQLLEAFQGKRLVTNPSSFLILDISRIFCHSVNQYGCCELTL
jgi:hypothetical protein